MTTPADDATYGLEIERTYDVDAATPLPAWESLPGIAAVGAPETRMLDARYYDTDALDLARAKVALRRRTGGHDAGWHVKASAAEGRHEWGWPLGDDDSAPDAAVLALKPWAAPPFSPLARIRNERVAYALLDAAGELVAEVVDDHVDALAERDGIERSWREWEVELGAAAPDDAQWRTMFFAAVDALVLASGGRIATSTSKLGRALGA